MRIRLGILAVCVGTIGALAAEPWPKGVWVSEGQRGQVEIYPCAAPGHPINNETVMNELCRNVAAAGRLCGRVVKVLPNGVAELKAKGRSVDGELGKPMLCIAPNRDPAWPWKGHVFNPDDEKVYVLFVTPDGETKLRGKGCGFFGMVCPQSGQFVWSRPI